MDYYSIRNAIICLVDDGQAPSDGYTQDIQVHIVQEDSFDGALRQALVLGKEEEQEYLNEYGKKVRWAFKEVEAVTRLGASVVGVEISSRMESLRPEAAIDFNTVFRPEASQPEFCDETNT